MHLPTIAEPPEGSLQADRTLTDLSSWGALCESSLEGSPARTRDQFLGRAPGAAAQSPNRPPLLSNTASRKSSHSDVPLPAGASPTSPTSPLHKGSFAHVVLDTDEIRNAPDTVNSKSSAMERVRSVAGTVNSKSSAMERVRSVAGLTGSAAAAPAPQTRGTGDCTGDDPLVSAGTSINPKIGGVQQQSSRPTEVFQGGGGRQQSSRPTDFFHEGAHSEHAGHQPPAVATTQQEFLQQLQFAGLNQEEIDEALVLERERREIERKKSLVYGVPPLSPVGGGSSSSSGVGGKSITYDRNDRPILAGVIRGTVKSPPDERGSPVIGRPVAPEGKERGPAPSLPPGRATEEQSSSSRGTEPSLALSDSKDVSPVLSDPSPVLGGGSGGTRILINPLREVARPSLVLCEPKDRPKMSPNRPPPNRPPVGSRTTEASRSTRSPAGRPATRRTASVGPSASPPGPGPTGPGPTRAGRRATSSSPTAGLGPIRPTPSSPVTATPTSATRIPTPPARRKEFPFQAKTREIEQEIEEAVESPFPSPLGTRGDGDNSLSYNPGNGGRGKNGRICFSERELGIVGKTFVTRANKKR